MKKILISLLLACFIISSLSGCAFRETYSESTFYAMNTFVTVRLSTDSVKGGRVSAGRLEEIHFECERIVAEVEKAVSVTLENSDTARFNDSQDGIESGNQHFLELVRTSLEITVETGGAFRPTLRILSDLWDITGAGYVPTEAELRDAMRHISYTAITAADNGVQKSDPLLKLDFGAIAKGYAAQLLIEYLDTTEISHGLVSLGGNVGLFGKKTDNEPYKIGITDPRATGSVLGYLHLDEGFVSVSGDYERYFERDGVRYHHILDPETGAPARSGLVSVAVIAEEGALADALSTALFVMGVDRALAFYESGAYSFEAVFVTDDGQVILTKGLSGKYASATDAYTVEISSGEG